MKTTEAKIQLRHPMRGKTLPRISQMKYDLIRRAILAVVPRHEPGLPFAELPDRVSGRLSAAQRQAIGSIAWYTVSVKLHMERLGEIRRVAGSAPQRLVRAR
jgi:hypothetical protein